MATKKLSKEEEVGFTLMPHPKMPVQPREKPMEVLCLGLSRTGTMSTYLALRKLGVNSYHIVENFRNAPNGSLKRWREAIEAKYFDGDPTKKLQTAEDFDQLLWQYQGTMDVPCVLFADELLAAYPDAKVVLTERDEDGWIRSMQASFYEILRLRILSFLEVFEWDHLRHILPTYRYTLRIWTNDDMYNMDALRKGYRAHNAHIREVVPKEKLLVFHAREGWEPLCHFLGKPVPNGPFPRFNEGMYTYEMHRVLLVNVSLLRVFIGFLKRVAPLAVGAVGWWAYQRYSKGGTLPLPWNRT